MIRASSFSVSLSFTKYKYSKKALLTGSAAFPDLLKKILPAGAAHRYFSFTDPDGVVPDRPDLIQHDNIGLMHPGVFSFRQFLFYRLHTELGKNGPGRTRTVNPDIVA